MQLGQELYHHDWMANVIIRCPPTGMNVQIWLAKDDPATDQATDYESLRCPACLRIHFVNKITVNCWVKRKSRLRVLCNCGADNDSSRTA